MARSDLLVTLVEAGAKGDRTLLRHTVEAIVAEERSKQHHNYADRLLKAFDNSKVDKMRNVMFARQAPERDNEYLDEIRPSREIESLMLPEHVKRSVLELVAEQHRMELLRAHGLEPRHKVMLAGPPGNGKTSLAEALAYELGVPFFVVRYDAIIGSFLGETASRLRSVFDFVRRRPCVIFFDEFDALGKERGDTHETGEIKRVVSSLLMQIDALPSHNIVLAATNHPELLDRAVWRRFQLRLELPNPSPDQILAWLERYLATIPEFPAGAFLQIVKHMGDVSFSEVEQFCLNVKRQWVLSIGSQPINKIIANELKLWQSRYRPSLGEPKRQNARKTTSRSSQANSDRQNYEFPGLCPDTASEPQ